MNTNYNFRQFQVCTKSRCPLPIISRENTAGNNPTITKASRYSEYVNTVTPKNKYTSGNAMSRLQKQGIISVQTEDEAKALGIDTVDVEPNFVKYTFRQPKTKIASLKFTNLNSFNADRVIVFSKNQINSLSIFPTEKL